MKIILLCCLAVTARCQIADMGTIARDPTNVPADVSAIIGSSVFGGPIEGGTVEWPILGGAGPGEQFNDGFRNGWDGNPAGVRGAPMSPVQTLVPGPSHPARAPIRPVQLPSWAIGGDPVPEMHSRANDLPMQVFPSRPILQTPDSSSVRRQHIQRLPTAQVPVFTDPFDGGRHVPRLGHQVTHPGGVVRGVANVPVVPTGNIARHFTDSFGTGHASGTRTLNTVVNHVRSVIVRRPAYQHDSVSPVVSQTQQDRNSRRAELLRDIRTQLTTGRLTRQPATHVVNVPLPKDPFASDPSFANPFPETPLYTQDHTSSLRDISMTHSLNGVRIPLGSLLNTQTQHRNPLHVRSRRRHMHRDAARARTHTRQFVQIPANIPGRPLLTSRDIRRTPSRRGGY